MSLKPPHPEFINLFSAFTSFYATQSTTILYFLQKCEFVLSLCIELALFRQKVRYLISMVNDASLRYSPKR